MPKADFLVIAAPRPSGLPDLENIQAGHPGGRFFFGGEESDPLRRLSRDLRYDGGARYEEAGLWFPTSADPFDFTQGGLSLRFP